MSFMQELYTERTEAKTSADNFARIRELETVMGDVIKGKPEAVRLALVALLAGGHLDSGWSAAPAGCSSWARMPLASEPI